MERRLCKRRSNKKNELRGRGERREEEKKGTAILAVTGAF